MEEGYYKLIDGIWVCAVNGIILPNTTEPTLEPSILEENGWIYFNVAPDNPQEESDLL